MNAADPRRDGCIERCGPHVVGGRDHDLPELAVEVEPGERAFDPGQRFRIEIEW